MPPNPSSVYRCLEGCSQYALSEAVYQCTQCGALLEVTHSSEVMAQRQPEAWKALFEGRTPLQPGLDGSGVWRFREWVMPHLPLEHIVTLGEGNSPLVHSSLLSDFLGVELLLKQCGHGPTGSFKDLGMTVLVSQVNHLRARGQEIRSVACASTGDTSAALAAYGAAADLPTLILLPKGKITATQLLQPLAHGARVLAVPTDFDGCMKYIQRLAEEEQVYLANSKNSLRIEGQKTAALEIILGLGWRAPDWIAIPGGNLGNVSALAKGLEDLERAGILHERPRILCAQSAAAAPLFNSAQRGDGRLETVRAQSTQATAIQIGNPVSFSKAQRALQAFRGVVEAVSEQALAAIARRTDQKGFYLCPQTAVALAAVQKQRAMGTIKKGERVVVVATAHGLKFTEFKQRTSEDCIPGVSLGEKSIPQEVDDDWDAVRKAAFA